MAQPVSYAQYKLISGTAAGTAVICPHSSALVSVFIPANATGTVVLYNDASGVSTDIIGTVTCTVGSIPTSIPFGCNLKNGLAYSGAGTYNMTVIYDA